MQLDSLHGLLPGCRPTRDLFSCMQKLTGMGGQEHASMWVKARVLWRVCVFSVLRQQLSRKALFDSAEQAELRGLPNKPWQPVTWKKAKVSRDYHLEIATVKYSVPYTYVGRQVEAKITG